MLDGRDDVGVDIDSGGGNCEDGVGGNWNVVSLAARSFAAFLAAALAWMRERRTLAESCVRDRTPVTSMPLVSSSM